MSVWEITHQHTVTGWVHVSKKKKQPIIVNWLAIELALIKAIYPIDAVHVDTDGRVLVNGGGWCPSIHNGQFRKVDNWLHANYVIYNTPKQSKEAGLYMSAQEFPPGSKPKSYVTADHDGTHDGIREARLSLARQLIAARGQKDDVDDET
jgi:hypothetical protein